ncbi:hypothetical protein KM043_005865 [Ampulex compressa]|nr:hypothetical protein KM043_005865 [Ampulex compressa]
MPNDLLFHRYWLLGCSPGQSQAGLARSEERTGSFVSQSSNNRLSIKPIDTLKRSTRFSSRAHNRGFPNTSLSLRLIDASNSPGLAAYEAPARKTIILVTVLQAQQAEENLKAQIPGQYSRTRRSTHVSQKLPDSLPYYPRKAPALSCSREQGRRAEKEEEQKNTLGQYRLEANAISILRNTPRGPPKFPSRTCPQPRTGAPRPEYQLHGWNK